MNKVSRVLRGVLALLAVAGVGAFVYLRLEAPEAGPGQARIEGEGDTVTVERTVYTPPEDPLAGLLADDTLDQKKAEFDPGLVDRRPIEGWRVNLSDAVLRLDVPMIYPDSEPQLLTLHPSYAAAVKANEGRGTVLPSVNMIDGKAKQFDDGLYAAIDQAYYRGLDRTLRSHVNLVRTLYEKVGPSSPAAPYLAAGLDLAGVKVEGVAPDVVQRRLRPFLADEVASKPIGFYTWNPTLAECFRFLRYFQGPIKAGSPEAGAILKALGDDKALLEDCRKAVRFYARLTNPPAVASLAGLVGSDTPADANADVSLFPPSTSRENELFAALFPMGLPPGTDLMRELIVRIRSGEVDLQPKPGSGWYEYQVYALETLLLPEKGAEHDRLLLTRAYKKRMLEAFKALITKRRETHARVMPTAEAREAAPPPPEVRVGPRLRVEPCPSYFLRTARAYDFLAGFLESAVGQEALGTLHGLREGKEQAEDLRAELATMRSLFYGLYLLSAEDIGLKPDLRDDEMVDRDACEKVASDWLSTIWDDPDLARDTRVSVPIFADRIQGTTRLWATLGVRMSRLDAGYARAPRIRPEQGEGDWKAVEPEQLDSASYLIPVDEFAEVELRGSRVLNRQEWRALCDRYKSKEAIIEALRK